MKRLTITLFAFIICLQTFGQGSETKTVASRPDIKGDLFVDFGFNTLNNRPEDMSTRFFASRTFNIYLQRPIYLGETSGLTFNPGIGLGLDKMAFADDKTLINDPDKGSNSSQLVDIMDVYGDNITINSNTMAANYVDIPLEFRYHLNKSDYKQGFRFALGAKVGFLFDSHTKIKFTDTDGLERKIKDKQSYGLSPFRYGIYSRIGLPGFNLWAYYGLNEVFKNGQGPFETQTKQFNFGLSFALF